MFNPYEKYVLPRLINGAMGQPAIRALRRSVVPRARGEVLEVGFGSGLNFEHYGPEVRRIVGVDPSPELKALAEARPEAETLAVELETADAERLPFESNSFDTVLLTWTLCSIRNPYQALREMRRVLRPRGELLFVEHGRARDPGVQRWQQRINPLWKALAGGCHLNRSIDRLIVDSGFSLDALETGHIEGPRIATFMYQGVARPR